MGDVVGPIITIVLIFIVYWVAQQLDVSGETKLSKLEIKKIDATTRQREAEVRARELEVEMGRLAIEARKLDKLEHIPPTDAEDAEFRVLEDKRDDEEAK